MYAKYFVLFAILFTGYFLRKIHFLDDNMNHGLNKFIVYFAYPCMIVHNLGTLEMNSRLVFNFLLMFLMTVICLFIYSAYEMWYCRLRRTPREISHIVEFASLCPNNGFMGFPITLIFFGEEGLFLMLAHNAALNFFFFTYGLRLVRRNKDEIRKRTPRSVARAILKVLLNPNIVALTVGFIISVSRVGLPGPVDEYLLYLGNVSTPMAMIFIGSTLAGCNLLEILRDHVVIEATINKLLLLPVLTFALVYFLPIDPLIKAIITLGCCFPTAATVSMLAEQEGEDQTAASKVLFLSTLASIATIPLSIQFIEQLLL